jgi:putative serine protease PepD
VSERDETGPVQPRSEQPHEGVAPAQPGWTPPGGWQPPGPAAGGGSGSYGTPPSGTPPYGAPSWSGSGGYGGHPGAGWTPPRPEGTTPQPPLYGADPQHGWSGGTGTAVATDRRPSRLRIGIAGLVAGAVIGGGTGAGVVALTDRSGGTTATASGASAQSVVIKDPQNATTATAAAAKAAPSVVTLYVTTSSGAGSGSGVVLSADGYVLTNNHVVTLEGSGNGSVQVRTPDGKLHDASVVGTDPSDDLAVVKLSGVSGLTPATFADSDKVQVGDVAVAIGAPLGLSNTVTDGIISATNRAVETGQTQNDTTVIDALQTDAAINPGNSGGALVNGAGQVVGINTAIASVAQTGGGSDAQSGNIGVGFAIPANTAKRIADQIIKSGSATHAVLGVSARDAGNSTNPDAGTGAQVVQVVAGGAAEKAGVQTGDVITAVDDRLVTSSVDLTAAVRSTPPGQAVTLTVERGNGSQKLQVTLGETNG